MTPAGSETAVRLAALDWVDAVSLGGTIPVTRDQLAKDFLVGGERFPLVDRARGIRKPRGWTSALSIMSAMPRAGRTRAYEDNEGADGLQRYNLRADEGGAADNDGLRVALRERTPLIWFYGIAPGLFNAVSPVWLTAEEPDSHQFVVALSEGQRTLMPNSPVEEGLRRYIVAETKRRLHQPLFASRVMLAYQTRCAVCALGHRALLDAAHILPDGHAHGAPVVTNGLALCKIHHAAYDGNILGIRPDYVVQIHHRLLDEIDGPMLRHGLQDHHDRRLMTVPGRADERPDPERLMERYAQFLAA